MFGMTHPHVTWSLTEKQHYERKYSRVSARWQVEVSDFGGSPQPKDVAAMHLADDGATLYVIDPLIGAASLQNPVRLKCFSFACAATGTRRRNCCST